MLNLIYWFQVLYILQLVARYIYRKSTVTEKLSSRDLDLRVIIVNDDPTVEPQEIQNLAAVLSELSSIWQAPVKLYYLYDSGTTLETWQPWSASDSEFKGLTLVYQASATITLAEVSKLLQLSLQNPEYDVIQGRVVFTNRMSWGDWIVPHLLGFQQVIMDFFRFGTSPLIPVVYLHHNHTVYRNYTEFKTNSQRSLHYGTRSYYAYNSWVVDRIPIRNSWEAYVKQLGQVYINTIKALMAVSLDITSVCNPIGYSLVLALGILWFFYNLDYTLAFMVSAALCVTSNGPLPYGSFISNFLLLHCFFYVMVINLVILAWTLWVLVFDKIFNEVSDRSDRYSV